MSSVKELKSIDLSSYTIISTAVAVLFSIISSIVMIIGMGVMSPNALGISLYLVSTLIVGTFMYTIYNAFCQGFLYNILAEKLNTIYIKFKDDKEILQISTTPTAIIIAIIMTIQVILLYLASVFIVPLIISAVSEILMNSGQQLLAYGIYQFLILLSQPTTIAMIIFGTFIITFVFVLLGCYIYNILANTGRRVTVELSKQDNMTSVESVDVLKLAIVFAVVGGILNLIIAIISLISGGEIVNTLINIFGGFIGAFLEGALIAIFYNFIAPKLGKLKIELIDHKTN